MNKALVIFNPYSGRGMGARAEPTIISALNDAGCDYDFQSTTGPGHAVELARAAIAQGYATIIAAGGDGTVSEVVNGMMQARIGNPPAGVLGVIPIGSGNDFATMVGAPLEIEACARSLVKRRTRIVDVGAAAITVGPSEIFRYFDNNLGIGLEAAVIIESNKIRRLRGSLLYATAAVKALARHKSPEMTLHWTAADGSTGERNHATLLISVGNSRRNGGGFHLTPDAVLDDKSLDVAVARNLNKPEVLALLPLALFGKHTGHRAVTMLRVDTLRIEVPTGAPIQLDGEIVADCATAVEIGVLPHHLEVIVA